jgi:hypothetical protein
MNLCAVRLTETKEPAGFYIVKTFDQPGTL